jgi:Transglutaminase-like superfamily
VGARSPDAELVFGVAHPADQPFFAHAWLEIEGESVGQNDVVVSEIARLGGAAKIRGA